MASPAAATAPSLLGRELPDPPRDGITSLQFYADTALLLASSWDGVRCRVACLHILQVRR